MKKTNGKVIAFIRRNSLYLILGACILAIGLSITFMLTSESKSIEQGGLNDKPVVETPIDPDSPVEKPDDNPNVPVSKPIEFIAPVENALDVFDYSETMVFNSTLGRYSAHLAIDFYAPEGTSVVAVYDGVVEKIENSLLTGMTITIDHGNGLKTVYNSLEDGDEVIEGQTVKQGDVIGHVSVTNRQEHLDGAHLHFQVLESGKIINPIKYLVISEK